jgi:predicted GIY-YIG superfamily endonuclease
MNREGIDYMAFYVYILWCSDGSYYTGHTDDLEARLAAHEKGTVPGYTSRRRPVSLVFSDQFHSREDALGRERQIKGWSRAKKQALIENNWGQLVTLSQSKGEPGATAHPEPVER